MTDLSVIFDQDQHIERPPFIWGKWSLDGHLEQIIGDYHLHGSPDAFQLIYYPQDVNETDDTFLHPEKLTAILSESFNTVFVLERMYDKFRADSDGYGLRYYQTESFCQPLFCCSAPHRLPREFQTILWIDDDFLSDESKEFDYEAFALIDQGKDYLNPHHFCLMDFVKRTSSGI